MSMLIKEFWVTRLACLTVGLVLVAWVGPVLAATDPGDVYKGATWLLGKADTARDEGRLDDARESYGAALNVYQTITTQFPAWEKDLVRFRLSYCQDQITALSSKPAETNGDIAFPEEPGPDLDAMLMDARELCLKGTSEQAVDLLASVIRTAPENRQARELMGIVQLQLGHAEDAAAVLRGLSVEGKPSTETWIALAGAECALQEWSEARRCLDEALTLEPKTAIIHYNLAQLHLNSTTSDLEAASASYLKFLSLGGKHDPKLEERLKR